MPALFAPDPDNSKARPFEGVHDLPRQVVLRGRVLHVADDKPTFWERAGNGTWEPERSKLSSALSDLGMRSSTSAPGSGQPRSSPPAWVRECLRSKQTHARRRSLHSMSRPMLILLRLSRSFPGQPPPVPDRCGSVRRVNLATA